GQAVGGQEGDAAGDGQVVLAAVVAEELAVGCLAQGGFRNGPAGLAVIDEALEVYVEQGAELLRLEVLQRLLDLLGGDGVLGADLEGRVGQEVAAAFAGVADGAALADEGEDDGVLRGGLLGDVADGLEEGGAGGLLAAAALVLGADEQGHVLLVDAGVVLAG